MPVLLHLPGQIHTSPGSPAMLAGDQKHQKHLHKEEKRGNDIAVPHKEDGGFTPPLGSSISPKLRSQHPSVGTQMSCLISELLVAHVGLGRLRQKSCFYQKPSPFRGSENLPGWAAQGGATVSCAVTELSTRRVMLHGKR